MLKRSTNALGQTSATQPEPTTTPKDMKRRQGGIEPLDKTGTVTTWVFDWADGRPTYRAKLHNNEYNAYNAIWMIYDENLQMSLTLASLFMAETTRSPSRLAAKIKAPVNLRKTLHEATESHAQPSADPMGSPTSAKQVQKQGNGALRGP